MKTIEKLLQEYHSKQSNLEHYRFGQWWCNEYGWANGVCPWSELFYEEDIVKAIDKINMWLIDNGYVHKMPKKTQELL